MPRAPVLKNPSLGIPSEGLVFTTIERTSRLRMLRAFGEPRERFSEPYDDVRENFGWSHKRREKTYRVSCFPGGACRDAFAQERVGNLPTVNGEVHANHESFPAHLGNHFWPLFL